MLFFFFFLLFSFLLQRWMALIYPFYSEKMKKPDLKENKKKIVSEQVTVWHLCEVQVCRKYLFSQYFSHIKISPKRFSTFTFMSIPVHFLNPKDRFIFRLFANMSTHKIVSILVITMRCVPSSLNVRSQIHIRRKTTKDRWFWWKLSVDGV